MKTLSVSDFRSQLATYFDLVQAGETIFIRRKNQLFTIIPVDDGEVDLTVTPELSAKIKKARQEYRDGLSTTLKSHEDVDKFFE